MSEGDEAVVENVPDAATCDARARNFAEITQTDEACAHFFLQDCQWNVEVALERFFRQSSPEPEGRNSEESEKSEVGAVEQTELDSFQLLTWNIDGLDDMNFATRMKAVCTIIIQEQPEIVFLQEVLAEAYSIIDQYLSDAYQLITGQNVASLIPYFTLTLLKRKTVRCISHETVAFPSTMMGRTLLITEANIGSANLKLMNTHLESMKEHAVERTKQLKIGFKHMNDYSAKTPQGTVVLAGDLNLREQELSDVGGIPSRVVDAWIECGSRKFTEYTWDCLKNDNKTFDKGFKPRARYDRVYVSKTGKFVPADLRFVGMDRIKTCLCYPSDHWGLVCKFRRGD